MLDQLKTSSHQRRLALFLITAAMLFVSMLAVFLMGNAVVRANENIVTQQAVIDHVRGTLSTVKDAETGQRGYVLTGESRYLEPYTKAVVHLRSELQVLDDLEANGSLPTSDVARFKELVHSKLAELEQTVNLRRDKGFEAALAVVKTDVGMQFMVELRELTATIIARETDELRGQEQTAARATTCRTLLFFMVTLLNLGFLFWAYRRIQREINAREAGAAEVLRQKELLQVTLTSIGDGVMVTDANANITFLNKVAEKLTGWSSEEAVGQPCATVFNIINETSRKRVESPVDKVLRDGLVVGLANHTLLIRKDGTEIPIDDSGAPVRGDGEKILGVVLVFRDFSEHKKVEGDLIRAKEAAEEANIAKDNFLATLSHELRTPLTPVLGTLTAWEASGEMPQSMLPDVQMMRRNIDLEARLIDDLLDLTRIVRGKLSLNPEVADLHTLIVSAAGMYQSEIHTKRLGLSMNLRADQHYVFADPARLQQVLWNVLKNATKFTNEGGKIEISTVNFAADQVQVIVHDDGIGMTEDLLGKLFLPFEQGTHDAVKRYGGLGLGLAISKALMDAQGGSIAAQSAGPGHGSTFTVGLPFVSAPDGKDTKIAPPPADAPARLLNILLVEDHVDTARVLSRLFTRLGHKVGMADSVATAMDIIAGDKFDVIVSDIGLPDGTGIDLIQKIRELSDIPAIALTGFGMDEDIARCKDAGFDDHLTKPVNFQRLESMIRQVTSRNA